MMGLPTGKRAIGWAITWLLVGLWPAHSLAGEEITPVHEVLSNPSKFHRHVVVLKGVLKLTGRWEGKDVVGMSTCGPIFNLRDDTGEIPIFYVTRCDQQEVARVSALSGGLAIVNATIQSDSVVFEGAEYHTRAMASQIRIESR